MSRFKYILPLVFCVTLLKAQEHKNIEQLDHWYAAGMEPNGVTSFYNEVWGFEQNGAEYAVIGSQNGTHILAVADDGILEEKFFVQGASHGSSIVNRDFAYYKGYLYSICDQGFSTLQIIDVQHLPNSVTLVYDDDTLFGRAHTIWFDEAKQRMYIGGPAGYAMKIFDVSNPIHPTLIYTHIAQGYIHDMYVRNDTAFLNAAHEGLHIYNFSNLITPYYYGAFTGYTDPGYNHSGKLSSDGKWYVFADESAGTRVKLLDVRDLTDIKEAALMSSGGDGNTIAHDPIFWKDYVFIAYYYDGLIVFDVKDKSNPKKIAWFDSYTGINGMFKGVWGVYVLPSGKVLISDRQNGLYVLEFLEPPRIETTAEYGVFPNPVVDEGYFYYSNTRNLTYTFTVYDVTGKKVMTQSIGTNFVKFSVQNFDAGVYMYEFRGINNPTELKGKFLALPMK